jgi:proteasome accessory factor C
VSPRLTARDRMARLLTVIPWVVERDGASVEEISARFDYPRDQLMRDLTEVLLYVGVHPFTPDTLIEVDIRDDMVNIRYADWFAHPLRLTADDGARLLTAGRTVLSMTPDRDEQAGPLVRALAKLELALGDGAGQAVEVRLGEAPEATLEALRRALSDRRQIEIEYYAYGRDELTTRRVDPARIFSDRGQWYLAGWCHRADAERVFRVDRIRSIVVTEEPIDVELPSGPDVSFSPSSDDPRITLRLSPSSAWVTETYPTESTATDAEGYVETRMAVTAQPWLERLLLRLGPEAEVLEADARIGADITSRAATRLLARYSPDHGSPGTGKASGADRVDHRE